MTQPNMLDLPPLVVSPAVAEPERTRLNAAALRVLAYLQQHGSATNYELVAVGGLRAVGRKNELEKHGYTITKQHEGGGVWRYTLEVTR